MKNYKLYIYNKMKDRNNKDIKLEKNENHKNKKPEFNIDEILIKMLESRK